MAVPCLAVGRGIPVKFVFRADASIKIGTGHVMRCLTLADELMRIGNQCLFVCRDHQGNLGDVIKNKGHGLTLLSSSKLFTSYPDVDAADEYSSWLGTHWQEDARQTLDAIKSFQADWLIVDHYSLDASWERQMLSNVRRMMVIDDLKNRKHVCSLLLDQNLGRVFWDYDGLVPADCLRLLGPSFAILRPDFSELRKQSLERREAPGLKQILISMGGVDRRNLTGAILDALAASPLPADAELNIIMGSNAPHIENVIQRAERLNYKTTISVDVTDMAFRMCHADFSIGAAGSTSWERCCMGLPSITVAIAENQLSIARSLSCVGACLLLETSRVKEDLPALIELYARDADERLRLARNASEICDGRGVERVVSALMGDAC